MNLVIVESPTKSRTIQQFLGRNYKALSSYGHIRDLPKSKLGIDVENDFEPQYIVIPKTKKIIQELKKEAKKAKSVILATDGDREGEAIAYHLTQILSLNGSKPYQRIVFHEITKRAIEEAIKSPRKIDMNLVDAQQARRILDRIVGYKLSPFLWEKVARGLSAGRVQSVAVQLIVEREREIENFVPQEYWQIEALLKKLKNKKEFEALLIKKDGKVIPKLGIKNKKEADKIIKDLKGVEYKITKVEKKETKRNPLPPFTTSTLQQEAWQRFRFPAKFTMRIAQQLYERGHTTYHRTDSLNLSNLSLFAAKKFIIANYGKNYWAGFLRKYKAKGKVQEAHEAIRPTYPDRMPEKLKIKAKLDNNQYRLYDLVWRRFIACQMAQAIFDSTNVEIQAKPCTRTSSVRGKNYTFKATGQILKFDGFLKVYPVQYETAELPQLKKEEVLKLIKLIPSQHFTQPPSRYSEATLIKALENKGIGRPSTYASILSTIQERNYTRKDENKRFEPTRIGTLVNDLLVENFPRIVNINFTAEMEDDLDKIANAEVKWVPVIKKFYDPFIENLEKKRKKVSKKGLVAEKTDKICPKCGAGLVIKISRFGEFYACSNYPKCRYTKDIPRSLNIKCLKCKEGEIVERRTRNKKLFYGCSLWPDCDFASWDKPTGEKCSKCGSLLVINKWKKIKCSNKDCNENYAESSK